VKLLFRAALDIIFPPHCHHCKAPLSSAGELHLCPVCRDTVPLLNSPFCLRCGVPFATEGGIDHLCGDCQTSPPPFAAARAAVVFAGPVRELIHRFKYNRKVQLRRPLGLMAAQHLEPFVAAGAIDLIVPVPLHVRRLRERGFNQAVLLGEFLARRWRLPLSRHNLRRIRWTEPQINLSAAERHANVRGAFAVHKPDQFKGKRILLVDDVYTTGSTVAECARTLRGAGATVVFVATVARAVE
jgi:ComF family protein